MGQGPSEKLFSAQSYTLHTYTHTHTGLSVLATPNMTGGKEAISY